MLLALLALGSGPTAAPPLPTTRQLEWMDLETIQFMHFSIPTSWNAPDSFLRRANPTFHNCAPTWIPDHSNQTGDFYPCLNPAIFQPDELDVEQWMAAASSLGMREICLTAKHAGGFTLWPSKFTPYGVQGAMNWRDGKGDVLKAFVAAAKRWNIKICYYINPMTDGYLAVVANVSVAEFQRRQKGMMREVLTEYGPVNRLWFDGVREDMMPKGLQGKCNGPQGCEYYDSVFALIREISPQTLISAYRGDVCASIGSLYTNDGPAPNGTSSSECLRASETGKYFHPSEMHGVTMQEGPDGNTAASPTYWFWHDWACAGNVSGCPWVGHSNASRIFDGYVATVGHGGVLNMNIAPDATGRMNASVVAVMREAGQAINDTFKLHNAGAVHAQVGPCVEGVVVLDVEGEFDYIVTMEDLTRGQRIGNYSIDYKLGASSPWRVLVPPVQLNSTGGDHGGHDGGHLLRDRDRPDGHDPRDQYIGHKRIDVPIVATSGPGALPIAQVRLNCHRLIASVEKGGTVFVRSMSLHKKRVPWE